MSDTRSVTLIEQAWDEAASGYDAYFGPRFAPYLAAAVGALLARSADLPPGNIVVPCAGPGRELGPLSGAFPERAILGSDLSNEMVALARARNARFGNVSVERADATALAPEAEVAGLLSVFGLQLLPDQPATLASWVRLLASGGIAVVVYWPRDAEPSGPFHALHRLLRKAGLRDGEWEAELVPSALRAGGQLLCDARLGFAMQHSDPRTLWDAFTRLGPLRALALARGQALIDALGAEFVAELADGPVEHAPAARVLVIARR
ncbi:MAG: class I SAM-dependent methyltransferase [Polyangiaceae bacterium]